MLRVALFLQNKNGVEITFGTENYIYISLFCMANYFVERTPLAIHGYLEISRVQQDISLVYFSQNGQHSK